MLLSFSVRNFRSFRDEQTLSMTRSRRIAAHNANSGPDVNPVTGVYGGNASGKSNLLLALRFMGSALRDSHAKWGPDSGVPFDPFRLAGDSERSTSRFEVDVSVKGVRYQYGFELTAEEIRQEWLYAYPHGRQQTWFERDSTSAEQWHFGKNMTGKNRVISELTRPNSLFLSTAAASKHDQISALYSWFSNDLRFADHGNFNSRLQVTLNEIKAQQASADQLKRLLKVADLGICDMKVINEDAGARRKMLTILQSAMADVDQTEGLNQALDILAERSRTRIELQHSSSTGQGEVSLPFDTESMGTRSLIALGGPVLQALRLGHTLLVDEIDTSLHPSLVAELVRLFKSPTTNPGHAQLIFTSHDTALLGNLLGNEPVLDRDQTWFVEKDQAGASALYPLTDFHPRKQENLERGYLQGRYGALPFVNMQKLVPQSRNPSGDT